MDSGSVVRPIETLCSRRDPQREAETWVSYNLDAIQLGHPIIILGAGSGYHIREFKSQFPDIELIVAEVDPVIANSQSDVILIGNVDLAVELIKKPKLLPIVLPFRASWQGMETHYQRAFHWLTLRDPLALKLFDPGFSKCNFVDPFLTAKSLKNDRTEITDKKLFHLVSILGELLV